MVFRESREEVPDRKRETPAGEDRPVGHHAEAVGSQDAGRSQELRFLILKLNLEGLIRRDFIFFQFEAEKFVQGQD